MKITFYSNFLNHYQKPFCDEMVRHSAADFTFVSTEMAPEERLQMGFQDYTNCAYNLTAYTSQANYNRALQLGIDSDIVIIGAAPDIFIEKRLRQNKHTFRYSERYFKRGRWQVFDPRMLLFLYRCHAKYRRKNLYMLCASAYVANDLSWVFAYPHKKFKWGYFPSINELNIEIIIANKPAERVELLWVGRFLDWKHPEMAVQLAGKLKQKGYNFHLNMIGIGPMADIVQQLIHKLNVADRVSILGGVSNTTVIDYMRQSHIFLFTSDRNEGWGAVLSEAMSNGCAAIASHAIGSAPFLIKHQQNGLIFESGDSSDLFRQAERLILDEAIRNRLILNAYNTIKNEWSPEKTARNFQHLAKSILEGQKVTIDSGPCSEAKKTRRNYWKTGC